MFVIPSLLLSMIPMVLCTSSTNSSNPLEGVDPNTLSCDPIGLEFLLLPHRTDCDKFYMCTHGQEVMFSCPQGLIFDFELQVCNWPWATECTLRTPEGSGEGNGEVPEGSGEEEWGEGSGDIPSIDDTPEVQSPNEVDNELEEEFIVYSR